MKKKFKIPKLHLIPIFIGINNCYSQYTIIQTVSETNLTQLKKSENTIIINGINNFLVKCSGDCDQLIQIPPNSPINTDSRNLNVLDSSTYFLTYLNTGIQPYNAIITKTNDGGLTWNNILDTLSNDFYVCGLIPFDTNHITLLSSQNRTFNTENNGVSWSQGPSHGMPISTASLRINDSTAIAGVNQLLRITYDQGNSWIGSLYLQADPLQFSAKSIDSIYFVSAGLSGTYLSYFFGDFTSRIDKPINIIEPTGLYVVSKEEIYIIGTYFQGNHGRILKTTDLGNTFSFYDIPETQCLYDMIFLNDTISLIGADNGKLIKWNKNSSFNQLSVNENQITSSRISISPNPTFSKHTLHFENEKNELITIRIFDLNGKIINQFNSNFLSQENAFLEVDISILEPGVYNYQIQVGENIEFKKFIKL